MSREQLEQDLKDLETKFSETAKIKEDATLECYRIQGEYRYVQAMLAELTPQEDMETFPTATKKDKAVKAKE